MSARLRLASLLLLLPRLLSTLSRSFFDTPCRESRIQRLTRLFQRSVKTTTGMTTMITTTRSSSKNTKQSSRRSFFFHHSFSNNSRSHQFSHWKKKKKKKKNFAPLKKRRCQNFERRTKKMKMKSKNHLSAFVLTEKRRLYAFIHAVHQFISRCLFVSSERSVLSLFVFSKNL